MLLAVSRIGPAQEVAQGSLIQNAVGPDPHFGTAISVHGYWPPSRAREEGAREATDDLRGHWEGSLQMALDSFRASGEQELPSAPELLTGSHSEHSLRELRKKQRRKRRRKLAAAAAAAAQAESLFAAAVAAAAAAKRARALADAAAEAAATAAAEAGSETKSIRKFRARAVLTAETGHRPGPAKGCSPSRKSELGAAADDPAAPAATTMLGALAELGAAMDASGHVPAPPAESHGRSTGRAAADVRPAQLATRESCARFRPACVVRGCDGAGAADLWAAPGEASGSMLACTACGARWQSSWWHAQLAQAGVLVRSCSAPGELGK